MWEWIKQEQPCFSVEQIAQIIRMSNEPYRTIWRLVAETGIRRGEICGLNVGALDVVNRILLVQRSVTKLRKRKSPKAGAKRNGEVKKRPIKLSPSMFEQLRPFVDGRQGTEPLFLTPVRMTKKGKRIGGTRLEPDNFVKRHLKPIVKKLELEGAAHAFRHGNATLLDSLRAPWALKSTRLGHVDEATTRDYTHMISDDEVRISQELRSMLDKEFVAQDLPKFQPQVETASESQSEAV
jgi:integrase